MSLNTLFPLLASFQYSNENTYYRFQFQNFKGSSIAVPPAANNIKNTNMRIDMVRGKNITKIMPLIIGINIFILTSFKYSRQNT